MYKIKLSKLDNDKHKYKVIIYEDNKKIKSLKFGNSKYEDYTTHKDPKRKELYILRHKGMHENWNKSGILTKGFWSRWLLWNLPSLKASKEDIEKRFNVSFLP